MYSKQEASLIRKNFWTSFGQYMRPLPGAAGEPVNWLNYKSGVKHLYFRMDADRQQASVAIELKHPDLALQEELFARLKTVRPILEEITGEVWTWQPLITDEDGQTLSRIGCELKHVNIFNSNDWPEIISFLKPRILALDKFWTEVKHIIE